MSKYIVRADFYPNGAIILPLGITDEHGSTLYIDKVIRSERLTNYPSSFQFDCIAKDKEVVLKLNEYNWELVE